MPSTIQKKIAVLLLNTGSPDAPTPEAVRRYLAEFLGDPRVVELPRWKWWPILHGIILRTRPKASAQRYQIVWNDEGSPLVTITRSTAEKLNQVYDDSPIRVYWAMCYGNPSIRSVMETIRSDGIDKVLVMPLFAQYSPHTSAASFDAVFKTLLTWRAVPELRTVRAYDEEPAYYDALVAQIKAYWAQHGSAIAEGGKLVMSFHGVPQKSIDAGDQYQAHCLASAQRLAQALGIAKSDYVVSFQSRFGRDPWIQPYTVDTVKTLAQQALPRIDVVCPGFAADCLETIEEIDDDIRSEFLSHLPESLRQDSAFHYIPAINDSIPAITLYRTLIDRATAGWEA